MISGEEHTAQRDTPMARLQRERDRRTALAHDETISDNVKDSIKNLITHLGKSYRALYGMEIHDVIIRPNPAGTIVTCIVDVPGESTITLPEGGKACGTALVKSFIADLVVNHLRFRRDFQEYRWKGEANYRILHNVTAGQMSFRDAGPQ